MAQKPDTEIGRLAWLIDKHLREFEFQHGEVDCSSIISQKMVKEDWDKIAQALNSIEKTVEFLRQASLEYPLLYKEKDAIDGVHEYCLALRRRLKMAELMLDEFITEIEDEGND